MAFCAFTLLIGVVYTCSVRNARMFSDASQFQGASWLTALLVTCSRCRPSFTLMPTIVRPFTCQVALFLFNQPWYFVQFVKPSPIVTFVGTLCQLGFVGLLLLFWLCEFGKALGSFSHAGWMLGPFLSAACRVTCQQRPGNDRKVLVDVLHSESVVVRKLFLRCCRIVRLDYVPAAGGSHV
jgi:hypothetical protein